MQCKGKIYVKNRKKYVGCEKKLIPDTYTTLIYRYLFCNKVISQFFTGDLHIILELLNLKSSIVTMPV